MIYTTVDIFSILNSAEQWIKKKTKYNLKFPASVGKFLDGKFPELRFPVIKNSPGKKYLAENKNTLT